VLTKYETELEEKNVKTTETFEENLPETMVPDEQLKYILNSVLLYAVASALSGGSIEFSTRSLKLQRDVNRGQAFSEKVERCIEIRLVGSGVAKQGGGPGKTVEEILSPQKNRGFDLLLRLAKEVVQENRGKMRFETDEEKAKIAISLVLPVERRKAFFNRPASISPPTNSSVDSIPDIPSL
jgi:nitrogen-specific signal transduction histidine kinase